MLAFFLASPEGIQKQPPHTIEHVTTMLYHYDTLSHDDRISMSERVYASKYPDIMRSRVSQCINTLLGFHPRISRKLLCMLDADILQVYKNTAPETDVISYIHSVLFGLNIQRETRYLWDYIEKGSGYYIRTIALIVFLQHSPLIGTSRIIPVAERIRILSIWTDNEFSKKMLMSNRNTQYKRHLSIKNAHIHTMFVSFILYAAQFEFVNATIYQRLLVIQKDRTFVRSRILIRDPNPRNRFRYVVYTTPEPLTRLVLRTANPVLKLLSKRSLASSFIQTGPYLRVSDISQLEGYKEADRTVIINFFDGFVPFDVLCAKISCFKGLLNLIASHFKEPVIVYKLHNLPIPQKYFFACTRPRCYCTSVFQEFCRECNVHGFYRNPNIPCVPFSTRCQGRVTTAPVASDGQYNSRTYQGGVQLDTTTGTYRCNKDSCESDAYIHIVNGANSLITVPNNVTVALCCVCQVYYRYLKICKYTNICPKCYPPETANKQCYYSRLSQLTDKDYRNESEYLTDLQEPYLFAQSRETILFCGDHLKHQLMHNAVIFDPLPDLTKMKCSRAI